MGIDLFVVEEIEQSRWNLGGPTDAEWSEACRLSKEQRTAEKKSANQSHGVLSNKARTLVKQAGEIVVSMLPGCTMHEADVIVKTLWKLRLPHAIRHPLVTNATLSTIAMYNEWYSVHLLISLEEADLVRTNVWKLRLNILKMEDPF